MAPSETGVRSNSETRGKSPGKVRGASRVASVDVEKDDAKSAAITKSSSSTSSMFDFLSKSSPAGIVNPDLDETKFMASIMEAKRDVEKSVTIEAIEDHFSKIVTTTRLLFMVGILTIGMSRERVNPVIPIVALVLYHVSMWTIVAHHSCHGGLDKTSLEKYHRKSFGKGLLRRILDWPDLFMPEAWSIEHNKYHHYYLNENQDPDFVEGQIKRAGGDPPVLQRLFFNVMTMCTWRWSYYCINTFKILQSNADSPDVEKDDFQALTLFTLFSKSSAFILNVMKKVYLPYLLLWWCALPLTVGYFMSCPYWDVYQKLLIIELLTNIYTFCIIVTNHCGSDLYQFKNSYPRDTAGFALHAILGSVNYNNGNDFVDFLHGYLNYQIEHHMFPDMSCLG